MATEHDHDERDGLDEEELEQQHGEALPDREIMNILPIDPTAPSKWFPTPPLEPPA